MGTYMQGALKSGVGPSEVATDVAYALFSKSVVIDHVVEAGAGSDNIDVTVELPRNAQIIEAYVDTLTAWNSVTSAALTIGTVVGGTEVLASTDVKTNGRETTAPTAAQLAVWDDIGTTTTMHIRVAQVGNTSAGQVRVTFVFAPKL